MASKHLDLRATLPILVLFYITGMYLTQGMAVVSTRGHLFQVVKGLRMPVMENTKSLKVSDKGKCAILCQLDSHCLSVSYDTTESMCQLNQVSLDLAAFQSDLNENPVYIQKVKSTDWNLVFRATAGININVYDIWELDQYDNEMELAQHSIGCLTIEGRLPCNTHFRSWRLDEWQGVTEAKFGFYTNSECVFYVTFRVDNIDARDEMFSMDRIIDSSVPELVGYNGTYNYDSIQGLVHETCVRRFYLNQKHSSCVDDAGWMVVLESGCCQFEARYSYPFFWYTTQPTAVKRSKQVEGIDGGMAQVFAVFFKY